MVEIVESTPSRLVLRKSGRTIRPFLLGGVGVSLVAGLFAFATARTTSVRCVRGPAGLTCDTTEKLLGVIPLDSQRVEHVHRALVGETGESSDPSYRVELEVERGSDRPLSQMTVNKWQCQLFVRSFNAYVDSGKGAAHFLQLPDAIGIAMLLPLLAAALFCLAMARPYRLEIDRDRAHLTVRDGITSQASHALADIDDVRVEEREHDGQTVRQVFLLLKGGRRVQLAIEPDQVALVGDYLQPPGS
jgi:hypothetical protein